MLKIHRKRQELINHLLQLKAENLSLGFVPTMGALHRGHVSLVEEAHKHCDHVLASIFVNPNQFNKAEDLANYPVDLDGDLHQLELAGCHDVFVPNVEEIYPIGHVVPHYPLLGLETRLEGEKRPGHFQGVAAVLQQLFELVMPHKAFFGEKDFQQVAVVKWLVQYLDLNIDVVVCSTVRESGGLAMSSRNRRLSEVGKERANIIYQCLQVLSQHLKNGDVRPSLEAIKQFLNAQSHMQIDYLEVANELDFELAKTSEDFQNGNWRLFAAVYVEGVRLIDNLPISQTP